LSHSSPQPAAAYVRYSSEMQSDSFSLEAQERQIRRRAEQDDNEIVVVYADSAESAYRKKYRPGIKEMLEGAEAGLFDYLYVHKLDRLARRLEWVIEIVKELQEYDVKLKSAEQNFDIETPEGKLFFHLLASLGEFYSDNLSKETHKGKYERARQGYHNGMLPWGYESIEISISEDHKTKLGKLIPALKPTIQALFSRYATGAFSDRQMADWLNKRGERRSDGRLFTKDTLRGMLQNIYYAGKIRYRGAKQNFEGQNYRAVEGEIFEGKHEAAISLELFERCQAVRQRRSYKVKTRQQTSHVYFVNGLIVCSHCKRSMRAQSSHTRRYYREASREQGFADCPMEGRSVHADKIDAQIAKLIKRLRLPDNWKAEVKKLLDQDEDGLDPEKERARIRGKLREMRKMKLHGLYDGDEHVFYKQVEMLKEELTALDVAQQPAISQAADTLLNIQAAWEKATRKEQEELVKMVLDEVGCDIKHMNVAWVKPKPMFEPLFQLIDGLIQQESGRWILGRDK
jgi:DNA invertase Pin-like site-specific DNA recombinase